MKPLEGIRMIDLTHMISGPYGTMILADLGVETIKVEPPERGEVTRTLLANDPDNSIEGMGAYFMTLNRNKKSVTINLKTDEGRDLFYDLVRVSDIVMNNFSAGVVDKLGIGHDKLSAINPRIITCSVTGFGETGPEKHRTAFDIVAQAMSGAMSITGQPDSPPTRAGIPIGDLGGGMFGVIGILSAIISRERTGRGQHIDVAMLDTQVSMLNYMATMHLLSGQIPGRIGNAHFVHVPYNTFPTSDGYVIVAVITDNYWEALMDIVNAPDLAIEAHQHQPGRLANQDYINRRLGEIFSTNTKAYWVEQLSTRRIPCAPVYDFSEALQDVQIQARDMVVNVEHPAGGNVQMPGNPVKMSAMQNAYAPPPQLGQHNHEIFKDLLGKSDDELEALKQNGVI